MIDTEEKKKWKREISAGGVVYKKDQSQTFVLLVLTSGATAEDKQVWTFPKGHLDDQKPEEAAVREVREEGGVEARIVEKLGSVKYTFVWKGENIFKIVTWYLMEYVSGDPADHDHEVKDARWVTLPEAETMLKYKTDKEIIQKAKPFLIA